MNLDAVEEKLLCCGWNLKHCLFRNSVCRAGVLLNSKGVNNYPKDG